MSPTSRIFSHFTIRQATWTATASILLVSGIVLAQAETSAPAQADTNTPPPVPTEQKLPATLSDAKRQALELERRHRLSEGVPKSTTDAASPPAKPWTPPEIIAPSASSIQAPPENGDGSARKLDAGKSDLRLAAIAKYREAREALLKAQKEANQGATPEQKERADAALALLNAAREQLSVTREAIEQRFHQMTPEERITFEKKLNELRQEKHASRAARKEAHQAALKKDLGPHIARSDVRDELTTHAWRIARLQRVIELSSSSNNHVALKRAEDLLAKENEHHKKRLEALINDAVAVSNVAIASDAASISRAKQPPQEVQPATDLKPKSVPAEALQP